jgi:hypothetical protein
MWKPNTSVHYDCTAVLQYCAGGRGRGGCHLRRDAISFGNNAPRFCTIFGPKFYSLVTMHLGIILINNQLDAQFLLYIFISILYMFRATLCSSSGESIVSIHLVYVSLHSTPSGMQVGNFLPDLHTGRSPTQSDIYQMLYWYNWLSWWWAQGRSKHIENRNKYSWLFIRIFRPVWIHQTTRCHILATAVFTATAMLHISCICQTW